MIVVSQNGKTVFPLEQVMLGIEKKVGWRAEVSYDIVLYPLGANPLTEDPTAIAEFTKEEDAEDALKILVDRYGMGRKTFYLSQIVSEGEANG